MKLHINNATTSYLRNISFELENENVIILGSNGAGKTTLAKLIVSLIKNGDVTVDGERVGELDAKRRAQKLNFIPSKLEIFDEYIDVEEFLQLSLLNGSTKEKMDIMLKQLEIGYLKNSPCKCISSGEAQLVLFASALLHNAALSIFDEPTANLDSDKKIKVYEALKEYAGWKIIITHDLNLAYRLGYRVLYMEHGALVYDGSSESFFDPLNLEKLFGTSITKVDEYFMVNYR